jgi:putative membrane protein
MDLVLLYGFFKIGHYVGVISWMAGLFYLPRLFVYHVSTDNPDTHKTFEVMERKLYIMIMVPAMWVTLICGSSLVYLKPTNIYRGWFHTKMACVLGLVIFQFVLNHYRKQLLANQCTKSHVYFRVLNEVPTVLLLIIVFCAVFHPFG